MTSEDDFALLDAWRAGDDQAGNALFERHFDSIHRFFDRKVGGDAADLVQLTFLGCIEARERFRGASSFRTFLFSVAPVARTLQHLCIMQTPGDRNLGSSWRSGTGTADATDDLRGHHVAAWRTRC